MSERRGAKGLELWCKRITEGYPGVKVDNMTTSWRDGLAFCAIIHHFRPDLIDFTKLNKDDVYNNNDLAFRVAEQYLGIPALLEPEDMVEYSVPDRLSILTYLSQFYQAFVVAQGQSSVRISPKRPTPPNPDHGIVSPASTSPPTKMAFLGANKSREPCTKCNLPVFMAERLIVEKLLFHRTCFRCARCDSQLTPANSYETENNEFCCEICPDEGKNISKEKLLQRSVSDEEKTANLRTFSNEPDNYSALFETALESAKDSAGYSTARSEFFQSQLVSGSESGNEEVPPDLPNNAPPEISNVNVNSSFSSANSNIKDSVSKRDFVTKDKIVKRSDTNSLVRARARLFENNDFSKSDVYKKLHESPKRSIPIVKLDDLENFDDNLSRKSFPAMDDNNALLSSSNKNNLKHNIATENKLVEEIKNVDVEDNEKDTPDNVITEDNSENNIVAEKQSFVVKTVGDNLREDQSKHSAVIDEDMNIEKETNSNENSLEPIVDQLLTKTTVDVNVTTVKPSVEKEEEDDIKMIDDTQETEVKNVAQFVVTDNDEVKNMEPVKHVELEEKQQVEDNTNIDTDSTPDKATITHTSTKANSSPLFDKQDVITIEDSPSSVITISDSSSVSVQNVTDSLSPTSLPSENVSVIEKSSSIIEISDSSNSKETSSKVMSPKGDGDYPKDLNPFGEDDDEEPQLKASTSLNPFDSDSDDDRVEPITVIKPVPSPRLKKKLSVSSENNKITGTPEQLASLYTMRLSTNPFDSDEDVEETCDKSDQPSSEMSSMNPFWNADEENDEKQPVPIPRSSRVKKIAATKISLSPFWSYVEENDDAKQPVPTPRLSRTSTNAPEPRPVEDGAPLSLTTINFGSNSSISSGSAYGSARKKKPAPRPPILTRNKESGASSITSSPSHSLHASPKSTPRHRKNKRAPPAPPVNSSTPIEMTKSLEIPSESSPTKHDVLQVPCPSSPCILSPIPNQVETRFNEKNAEQEKIVKDEVNRNRQNQHTNLENFNENLTHCSVPPNKSTYGKWKRRKGQAPTKPIPQKRTIKCLPMTEIERELEMIELQQQGLERQGVRLEQIIRDKCESGEEESGNNNEPDIPIDIDDLLLQLFELMNEKVELFRKQTELMYLKRQQRLEEEHADVEYKIRCLMMLPEANKTDSDKASEEELIKRLVEIVEQRNRIIECLEMDRVREAREDDSITTHINLYTSKKEEKPESDTLKKDKEKEKKKHKKEKKSKHKSVADIDKDIDESEHCSTLEKKKKKKFHLSLF